MTERTITPKIIVSIKTLPLLVVIAALSGCASLSYPLPKCDGYNKRPLNRSMWEWDGKGPQEYSAPRRHSGLSTGNVEPLAFSSGNRNPATFASFDQAASHRVCGTG